MTGNHRTMLASWQFWVRLLSLNFAIRLTAENVYSPGGHWIPVWAGVCVGVFLWTLDR